MAFNSMTSDPPFTLQSFTSPGVPGIPVVAQPAQVLKTSGDSQTTAINTQFGLVLKVQVLDQSSKPVFGDIVNFSMIPGSAGASGTFANGLTTYQAATDANGFATSQLFTANGTAGSFSVEAVEQSTGKGVTFAMTSNPPQTVPGTPAAPTAIESNATTATLTFVPPDNGGLVISGYNVKVIQGGVTLVTALNIQPTGAGGTNLVVNSATASTPFNFLPGSTYTFQIAAVNSLGASGFSGSSAGVVWTTNQAPVVTAVAPNLGSTSVQTTGVVITGSGFTGASAVTVGGVAAASFVVNNDNQITATFNAAAATIAGVDVIVTTTFGPSQASSADFFFFGPQITSVAPNTISTSANTPGVVITGQGFTSASAVTVGGTNAVSFVVNSDTQITATLPSKALGTYDVVVTAPNGTSATKPADVVTAASNAPSISSIVNNADQTVDFNTAGGDTMIINGSGFTGATAVVVGATNVTSFVVNSDTKITATTSAHGAGTYHTKVTTGNGTNAQSANDLVSYGPVVGSAAGGNGCNPSNGSTNGGFQVVITGQFFTGATAVNFGAAAATGVIVNSDTQITCIAPAHASGVIDVTVVTPKGTSQTRTVDQFSYQSAPARSFQRLLYINQVASTILGPSDVAGYDFVSIQPTQVAGFPGSLPGGPSRPGMPAMGTPSDHYDPANPTGPGNTLRGYMSPKGSGRPPGIVVSYINGMHETGYDVPPSGFWGEPYNPVDGKAKLWYIYDATGTKVQINGTNIMQPITDLLGLVSSAANWGNVQGSVLEAVISNAIIFDGVFFDVFSTYSWAAAMTDALRGGSYTYDNFTTDLNTLAKAIMNQVPGITGSNVVFNSLQSSSDYFGLNQAHLGTKSSTILSGLKVAGMSESFMRGASTALRDNSGTLVLPSRARCLQEIQQIDDFTRVRGGFFQGLCKLWVTAPAATQDQWCRMAVAVLLLGYQGFGTGGMQFSTAPAKGGDTATYAMMDVNIGNPSSLASAGNTSDANVFYRQFQNGYVFLNTDPNNSHVTPIALPAGTWTDVGPKVTYPVGTDYPAAQYPVNPLGGAVYAGASTPTVPPSNALILRNY